MQKIILICFMGLILFAASGKALFAGGECDLGYIECTPEEMLEKCGPKHYNSGECQKTVMPDCTPINFLCKCANPDRVPNYNEGCCCPGGKYGPMDSSLGCTSCPSPGLSTDGNNATINDCFTRGNQYVAAEHGTFYKLCYWDGSAYNNCISSTVVSCDGGYYKSGNTCVPVGDRYYSPASPNSDSLLQFPCPAYTNPSGGQTQGYTTGSGSGADAITDCFIAPSDTWEDSTGSYSYNVCYYTL